MLSSLGRAIVLGLAVVLLPSASVTAQGPSATGAPPGAWDQPGLIASDGPVLAAVSCSSPTACWALGASGAAYQYDGSSWSAPVTIDIYNTNSISCPATDFCMVATLQGTAASWDGTSWTDPKRFDTDQNGTYGAACASATFCAAVNAVGQAYLWDGKAWGAAIPVDAAAQAAVDDVNAGKGYDSLHLWIDCPVEGMCMMVDSAGSAFALRDGSWSAAMPIGLPVGSKPLALSCASATFCVVGGNGSGAVATWDGTTWTIQPDAPNVSNLDCASATFCMAAPNYWYVYDGSQWLFSGFDVVSPPQLNDVDCPTQTFCVGVGPGGYVSLYHG